MYLITLVTRDMAPNEFEESFKMPYRKKTEYKDKEHKYGHYEDCIATEDQYDRMKPFIGTSIGIVNVNVIEKFNPLYIYSDGASYNNGKKNPDKPEYGSYGTVVCFNDGVEEFVGGSQDWTNNKGEISGALKGFEVTLSNAGFYDYTHVILVSDSQYVIKGITEWIDGWLQRGWKNNAGQPTKNKKDWEYLLDIYNRNPNIYFKWTRGHKLTTEEKKLIREDSTWNELVKNPTIDIDTMFNERCDVIASKFLKDHFNV